MVQAARERQTPAGEAALAWLCERYWLPLRTWAEAKGLNREDAEDLVQSFLQQALRSGTVGRADAERGKFRSYLLSSMEHHWTSQLRHSGAQKRGGGAVFVPLETVENSPTPPQSAGRTPEQEYDRAWAFAVLDRATERLAAECDADGHGGRFAVLRVFIDGSLGELPLADAAEQLGLSLPAVKSAVRRLRVRMGGLVREEISQTVNAADEVETELRALFQAVRS